MYTQEYQRGNDGIMHDLLAFLSNTINRFFCISLQMLNRTSLGDSSPIKGSFSAFAIISNACPVLVRVGVFASLSTVSILFDQLKIPGVSCSVTLVW